MAYDINQETGKLASKAKQMYFEGDSSSIAAFYGPYESLADAVDYFTTIVSQLFRTVPAGYKIGIIQNGEIKQEYIYIGGTITTEHFVPVIMDSDYASLKTKVSGIAAGAEVNQNAFGKVKVGSTTIEAEAKVDTLELVAGSNVTITPDTSNDKVTIAATDTTYSEATASTAGLLSASDKAILNQLVLVVQDGGWNVDSNFQVSQGGGSGSSQEIPANLQTTINRITNILGDLYDKDDNTGNSDGQIIIENDGNSNN